MLREQDRPDGRDRGNGAGEPGGPHRHRTCHRVRYFPSPDINDGGDEAIPGADSVWSVGRPQRAESLENLVDIHSAGVVRVDMAGPHHPSGVE
jgi:hypothetical protein